MTGDLERSGYGGSPFRDADASFNMYALANGMDLVKADKLRRFHELLHLDETVHKAIMSGADATLLHNAARRQGMITLIADAFAETIIGTGWIEGSWCPFPRTTSSRSRRWHGWAMSPPLRPSPSQDLCREKSSRVR